MEDDANEVEMQGINESAMIQIGRTILLEDFPKSGKEQTVKCKDEASQSRQIAKNETSIVMSLCPCND